MSYVLFTLLMMLIPGVVHADVDAPVARALGGGLYVVLTFAFIAIFYIVYKLLKTDKGSNLAATIIGFIVASVGCFFLYFTLYAISLPHNTSPCHLAYACECEEGSEMCNCSYTNAEKERVPIQCPNNGTAL